jgi:hypothetical protein
MRFLATFASAVAVASKSVGAAFKTFLQGTGHLFAKAKRKLRAFRLFAKTKTKAARLRMMTEMANVVGKIQAGLGRALERAREQKRRLSKHRKVAFAKLGQLHDTMKTLLPQIRYWIRTGFVAKNKIISLHLPELYAIVRGKVGKAVEFGLNWGITRLRGGFLLATLGKDKRQLVDSKFAVRAVKDHIEMFGKPPRAFAYDRGGWSHENVAELKRLGVKDVALAPRGKAKWQVTGKKKDMLVSERAQVEAGIATIKCGKYGFNRPAAKSAATMGMCGQRAVLGFNLNKLVRGLALRRDVALVG